MKEIPRSLIEVVPQDDLISSTRVWVHPCYAGPQTWLLANEHDSAFLIDDKEQRWALPDNVVARIRAANLPDFCLEGEAVLLNGNVKFYAKDMVSYMAKSCLDKEFGSRFSALYELFGFDVPGEIELLQPHRSVSNKLSALEMINTHGMSGAMLLFHSPGFYGEPAPLYWHAKHALSGTIQNAVPADGGFLHSITHWDGVSEFMAAKLIPLGVQVDIIYGRATLGKLHRVTVVGETNHIKPFRVQLSPEPYQPSTPWTKPSRHIPTEELV